MIKLGSYPRERRAEMYDYHYYYFFLGNKTINDSADFYMSSYSRVELLRDDERFVELIKEMLSYL